MHTILKMMMTMQLNPTHLTLSTRVAASTHCIKNTNFVELIKSKTNINFLFNFKVKKELQKRILKQNSKVKEEKELSWKPIFGQEMDF